MVILSLKAFARVLESIVPARSLLPLFETCATQDAQQGFVALVTGVLENRLTGGLHRQLHAPRTGKRRRIVDRELVEQRIDVCPRKALDQVQFRARAAEVRLVGEVGRVDNERLPFPVADRIALEPAYR